MNLPVINCQNLGKNFKSYKKSPGLKGSLTALFKREYINKSAVKDFSLTINPGEIVGLLGPNGAGKTTLMKMFTGIIVPSCGQLTINGHNPWERNIEFRKKLALVMGQKSQLWWDIPAMDSLELLQKYYEIPDKEFKRKVGEMSELLEVKDLLHIHVRKLSLGERMKLELLSCLLHSPEVIFLDEPTIGLDLVAQESIRSFIKNYREQNNCSIILTSHYMADIHALCERLVLIFNGEKKFDGPIQDFENILGNEKTLSFTFEHKLENPPAYFGHYNAHWSKDHNQVELQVPEEKLREVSLDIIKNFPVTEFNTEKMPIERVMKTLMKNPKILNRNQP